MKPALIIVLLGVAIGEYVAPNTERLAQSDKAIALGAGKNVASAHGVWHREGNTFMHLNAVQPDGGLVGVSLFRFDDQRQLEQSSFSERAVFQRSEEHTSELQSRPHLVCRLLLEKKKNR